MKYVVKIEKSGKSFVATCEQLPQMLVFADTPEDARRKANVALVAIAQSDIGSLKEKDNLMKTAGRLEKILDKLERDLLSGKISQEDYIEMKIKRKDELDEIRKKLANL